MSVLNTECPPQSVADIINRAANLVAERWTQNAAARDLSGRRCDASVPIAVSFCVDGAIYRTVAEIVRVGSRRFVELQTRIEHYVLRHISDLHGCPPRVWNDEHCQSGAEAAAMLRLVAATHACEFA